MLETALWDGDPEQAETAAASLLEAGIEPLALVQHILVPTMTRVGEEFQCDNIFLPELMMAGEAALRVANLVEKATLKAGKTSATLGAVVIGQAQGDMHDIGRNIVSTMLLAHGFKVIDLGRDVPASAFLEAAQREKASLVGISALMTTTLPTARRTINLFKEVNLQGSLKIVVGGGAASAEWAEQVGADGYAPDAASAVVLCKRLLEQPG